MFFRKPEHEKDWDADRLLSFRDPELNKVKILMETASTVFWMFEWKWQNQAWLDCDPPVFIDFGGEDLFWLKRKKQHQTPRTLYYLQVISKDKFVAKYSL